jgi:hypothetical protein
MKVQVKEDAFKGLTKFNGATMVQSLDKEGLPVKGKSGETLMFSSTHLGGAYLSPDQYTVLED